MSPVEQNTIECEYLAYFEPKKNSKKFKKRKYIRDIMQLFSADATIFKKNINIFFAPENKKKTPATVAHNRLNFFFSILPTGPKPAQILYSVP